MYGLGFFDGWLPTRIAAGMLGAELHKPSYDEQLERIRVIDPGLTHDMEERVNIAVEASGENALEDERLLKLDGSGDTVSGFPSDSDLDGFRDGPYWVGDALSKSSCVTCLKGWLTSTQRV